MTDGYIIHRMLSGDDLSDYELDSIWNLLWNGLKVKE